MSKTKPLIQVFPIEEIKKYYSFHRMGEFEILNLIGTGNFSEIFLAKPKEDQIQKNSKIFNYIIKIFQKNSLIENKAKANPPKKILFNEISEIHLLNKIKNIGNPNIIQMYDWSIDRKTCQVAILMEYMPYDLRNYFSKKENMIKLDENLLRKIAFNALNGLNGLHKNRIIHFNIKPENLLYNPEDNSVKITDFSLSQYIKYDLDNNLLINGGTYSYQAIEGILNTKKYSFSFDIWSLGCILMELSCGINPFEGKNQQTVLNKMITIFGLDSNSLTNFDEYCKNELKLNFEKKRIINYMISNQKIKFKNDEFYDLISRMLCVNPLFRIKAEEALKHPWFVNES